MVQKLFVHVVYLSWSWAVEVRDQELLMMPFSAISIARNNHFFAHAKQS